jgi:hypothetical protein
MIALTRLEVARFWSRVDVHKSDGRCWEWQGHRDDDGYGMFTVIGPPVRPHGAHRIAFEQGVGHDLATAEQVLHRCDNPPCCNPLHLFVGSTQDNKADCVTKDRHGRGDRNGRALLLDPQVVEMRARYVAGERDAALLGAAYGVSRTQCYNIVRGRAWKHLPYTPPPLDGEARQRDAHALRQAGGMTWDAIAVAVGYGCGESANAGAKAYAKRMAADSDTLKATT